MSTEKISTIDVRYGSIIVRKYSPETVSQTREKIGQSLDAIRRKTGLDNVPPVNASSEWKKPAR